MGLTFSRSCFQAATCSLDKDLSLPLLVLTLYFESVLVPKNAADPGRLPLLPDKGEESVFFWNLKIDDVAVDEAIDVLETESTLSIAPPPVDRSSPLD